MTPIPTNKGLLIPVVVPVDAMNLDIGKSLGSPYMTLQYDMPMGKYDYVRLGSNLNNPRLVGTLMYKDGEYITDFDVEPFVEGSEKLGWKQYHLPEMFVATTPQASFVSLLQSNRIGWVNPLGKRPTCAFHSNIPSLSEWENKVNDKYHSDLAAWQEAESRKLSVDQMVVLILINKA